MDENEKDQQQPQKQDPDARPSSTSPLGGKTHEATKPPGQGDVDEDAVRKSRDGLEQAGGGH
jgi:hypothetical protein